VAQPVDVDGRGSSGGICRSRPKRVAMPVRASACSESRAHSTWREHAVAVSRVGVAAELGVPAVALSEPRQEVARRVERTPQHHRSPVANGSSVPAWPTRYPRPSARRTRVRRRRRGGSRACRRERGRALTVIARAQETRRSPEIVLVAGEARSADAVHRAADARDLRDGPRRSSRPRRENLVFFLVCFLCWVRELAAARVTSDAR